MMLKYLTKKNTTYWYRRKIKNYGEVLVSLQTKNYDTALLRHSYFDFKIKTMVYKGLFETMTVNEIRKLINKYKTYMIEEEDYNNFAEKRDEDLSITINDKFYGGHTKEALAYTLDRYKNIHQSNNIDKVKEETSKILERSNLIEDYNNLQTDKEKTIFHWELLKAEWELVKQVYQNQKKTTDNLEPNRKDNPVNIVSDNQLHLMEQYYQQNNNQHRVEIVQDIKTNKEQPNINLTILELTYKYINEKRDAKGWSDKNERDINYALGKLTEYCNNKPANHLIREDFSSFRDVILKNLPVQANKKEYCNKTLNEIIEIVNQNKYKKIGITTINKHLRRVHQVFQWGYNSDYLNKNLTKDLKIVDKKKSKKQKTAKIPYSKNDLKKLFEKSPWFNQNIVQTMRYNPEYIFIPLLAIFTGAKPTELAQLRTSAIKKKNGILGIDFNQMIKTTDSERFTPLSQVLIDFDFMKYVKYQKKEKSLQLFPSIKVYKDNGTNFTNAFTTYNREFITKDKNKTFYSIRHLVNQMLKNKRIHSYIINDITGHSQNNSNMDDAIYGDTQMPEEILQEIINECLVYDYLDFSIIKESIHKLY